jgi:hypothetical protein
MLYFGSLLISFYLSKRQLWGGGRGVGRADNEDPFQFFIYFINKMQWQVTASPLRRPSNKNLEGSPPTQIWLVLSAFLCAWTPLLKDCIVLCYPHQEWTKPILLALCLYCVKQSEINRFFNWRPLKKVFFT